MRFPRRIVEEIQQARVAVENAMTDEEIQAKMESYGYTLEKMEEGKNKIVSLQQILSQQQAAQGSRLAATDRFKQLREALNADCDRIREVAKVAFREDRAIRQTLGINGRKPSTFPVWLEKSQQLCTNALADASILTRLGEFGITKAQLEAALQKISQVAEAYNDRKKKLGTVQQTTHRRNEKLRELRQWKRDFYDIARLALKEDPQLMEKIGLVEPSR